MSDWPPLLKRLTAIGGLCQTFSFVMDYNLVNTLAVILLGLTLASLIPAPTRRNPIFVVLLFLLLLSLDFLRHTPPDLQVVRDWMALAGKVVVLYCLFDDLWPHLKKRLGQGQARARRIFSSPVMPPA